MKELHPAVESMILLNNAIADVINNLNKPLALEDR